MSDSTNLRFVNTKSLKFIHTKNGVVASYKKKRFILGFLSISEENVDFTDNDYISLSRASLRFHCAVRNVPFHPLENLTPVSSEKIVNDFSPFYKYVPNEIFEKFIRKGRFQLGTIEQYRTIENIKQRDEFEGHSFLNLNINNRIVSSICSSGFNYLIFSGTKSGNSQALKKQFGDKELYFPNVRSFAEGICKTIHAKRYFVQNVEYNSLKLYVNKDKIRDSNIDIENILSPAYFDIIEDCLVYPSLFVKPETFRPENETRIVFEMPKDRYKPYRFEDKELLEFVEVINREES